MFSLCVSAQTITIPDPNFKAFLVANYDTSGDGEIQLSEAEAVTGTMDTPGEHGSPGNITDLTGIEYFTHITGLICSNEQLTALDVSANTALEMLQCDHNQLTALDVRANTALTFLDCLANQLTTLDVSGDTALQYLYCDINQLTALNVSGSDVLKTLTCSKNQLTTLDVSGDTALQRLKCFSNQLTTLDVSTNTALDELVCYSNQLTDIPDVTGCTGLNNYYCYGNYFNADDCATIAAIEAMGLTTFTYNPQADGYTLDCSGSTATHTITCGAGTGGSMNPTGAQVVYDGSSQIVHMIPDTGYAVLDVLVDGASVGPVTSYIFSDITADHTISASFTWVYMWSRHYGGPNDDIAYSIQQTSDGGYVVAGNSSSFTHGSDDFMIYKLDANGNKVWARNYGGTGYDAAYSIQQTSDGGYVVAGESESFTHGQADFMIYKLDANGHKVWARNYGGSGTDVANSIQQTSDGGYVVAGASLSFTHGGYGDSDFMIYKLDANGNKVWGKFYGGTGYDAAYSIQQTSDGGYVVAGRSTSFTHGNYDFLIYKLDSNGNQVWSKFYGGANDDRAYSIQQTSDGGYVVAGYSASFTHGFDDFMIYKLNSNGNKVWAKFYGGANNDGARSIQQTSDGGYVVAGRSTSFTHGLDDFLMYKLDANGSKVWARNYGGTDYDGAYSIQQTSDGGYVVAGYSYSFTHGQGDFMIYKLDANGAK